MPGHAHVFPDPAGSRTIANGTIPSMRLGAVGRTLPMHVVLLHHSLKTFAFGAADHIDKVTLLKLRDVQIHLAFRQISLEPKLARKSFRLDPCFLERAKLGIVQPRFFLRAETDLKPGIAIAL